MEENDRPEWCTDEANILRQSTITEDIQNINLSATKKVLNSALLPKDLGNLLWKYVSLSTDYLLFKN
jgi:hypothetical protein